MNEAPLADRVGSLLAPASIAIVGASDRPGPGRQVLDNLEQLGYAGTIVPVNPNRAEINGRRCYPSLSAAREDGREIEAVAVLLGRDRVADVLEEAGAIGARGAWAFASGFAEAGPAGKVLQDRIEHICRRYGIAFCGPNCVGYANPVAHSAAFSAPLSPSLRPGPVSVVAQSGSICMALANSARGIGFRLLISSGNEAVLDSTDYLEYLLQDPETDVVLAFIEEFRRPARFVETARLARSLGKPLVVLKVGRSETARRAAAAHTGALVGADAVCDAIFEKHGVIRVNDLDEMLETAEAFATLGPDLPRGNRVGMLAVSGGEIGLIGDLSRGLGLEFPDWSNRARAAFARVLPEYAEIANPLDAWGSGRIEETYEACIDAAVNEDIDLLVVSQDAPRGLSPGQVDQFSAVARAAAAARRRTGMPIVGISHVSGGLDETLRGGFSDGRVPLLQGTTPGLRAVSHLIAYSRFESAPLAADERPAPLILPEGPRTLDEIESQRLLSAWGLSYPPYAVCESLEEAAEAAGRIGYPVVVKVVSPDVPHKTDAGAVRTGITGPEALREAFDAVVAGARRAAPGARIRGVLVQRMVTTAVAEVILGVSRDEAFGPVVVFGAGGRLVEWHGDRSLAVPPVTRREARRMIERTVVGRLIAGHRGGPPGDDEALIEAILAVGRLAEAADRRLVAIDINPLLVLPKGEGVVAVDALVEVGGRR